jgi:hypothetical protein
MRVERSSGGFAVVEALVIGVIAAIVIAFAITIIFSVTDHTSQAAVCGAEARQFQDAVNSYHDRQDPQSWPKAEQFRSVQQLAIELIVKDGLTGGSHALAHLDGSQRTPVDVTHHGWKYDFAKHTVATKGCG